jgi:hypothetical protein
LPPGLREQVVDYPNTVDPWAKFEHALQEQFRIVLRIEQDRDVWAAGKEGISQSGFIFERLTNS